MHPPTRIPRIIKKLEQVWLLHPDYRLGQLISNLKGSGVQDVFYDEDEVWEARLDLEEYNKKLEFTEEQAQKMHLWDLKANKK